MNIKERLKDLADRYAQYKDTILTEEATKHALVLPFIKILGYDIHNPCEVVPEFIADVGIKKGEKVDYAIMDGNTTPILLIEVKCCGESLDNYSNSYSQLFRYFTATKAKIAVLTNGYEYRFYSDIDKSNILDKEPFFTFYVNDFQDENIAVLEHFAKNSFDASIAEQLKYEDKVAGYISGQSINPSEDFITFIARNALGKNYYEVDKMKIREAIKKTLLPSTSHSTIAEDTITVTLEDNPKTVTNHALISFTFDGKIYKQESYRGMLIEVIKLLDKIKPGKLEELLHAENWPQAYKLSKTPDNLRYVTQIKDNMFIRINISASDVLRAIKRFFKEFDVPQSMFSVLISSDTWQ